MSPLRLFFPFSLLLQGAQGQSTEVQYVVTSLAGKQTYSNNNQGIVDTFSNGVGTNAIFNGPSGIITTTSGGSFGGVTSLYVCDVRNNRIRNVSGTGNVDTYAGNKGTGSTNHPFYPTLSTFTGVSGIAKLPSSGSTVGPLTFFVTESNGNRVRRLGPSSGGGLGTSSPTVATTLVAGSSIGIAGSTNGPGASATFNSPQGIAVVEGSTTTLYVVDSGNNLIRSIAFDGLYNNVTTIAGSGQGFADGVGTAAKFYGPFGIAYYATGKSLYITDSGNRRVRLLSTTTTTVTTVAGISFPPGTNKAPQDGVGTNAIFGSLGGIFVFIPLSSTQASSIFVTDTYAIRKLTIPLTGDSTVSTIAGGFSLPGIQDGVGTNAGFDFLRGITVDSNGVVYVVDSNQNVPVLYLYAGRVRKLVAFAVNATPSTTPTSTLTRGSSPSQTPTTSTTPSVTPTATGTTDGVTPTPTSSPTPSGVSPTSTPSPSPTDLMGQTPSTTPTPLPTPSPSPTTVASDSPTPTGTPTPTTTVSASPTTLGGSGGGGSTLSPTPTPSGTISPTFTSSSTGTLSNGSSPSVTPTRPVVPSAGPNNNNANSSTPPLSPGSTAGIVIGSLVGVAALGAGAAFLMRGSKSKGKLPVTSSSGAPAQSIEVINNPLGGNGSNSATPSTSAPPAPTEAPLPEGWSQMSDETGDVWYVGPAGESVWTKPT